MTEDIHQPFLQLSNLYQNMNIKELLSLLSDSAAMKIYVNLRDHRLLLQVIFKAAGIAYDEQKDYGYYINKIIVSWTPDLFKRSHDIFQCQDIPSDFATLPMSFERQSMNYMIMRLMRLMNIYQVTSDLAADITKTIMLLSGYGYMSKNINVWFLRHYKYIQTSYDKENYANIVEIV